MSEYIYIEDRIAVLEKQMEFLQEDINTIKKGTEENNTAVIKTMNEVDRLKCEVRGTEYLDPLTDKPVDQSTEEFVRVVRCKDCKFYDPLDSNRPYDCLYMEEVFGDDYCSRGERI